MLSLRKCASVLCFVALVGCKSGTSDRPSAQGGLETSQVPKPTVEVAWFNASGDTETGPLFYFVSLIKNPGSKAISGLKTEWVAYDANNTIVGSLKGERSAVPPNGTLHYVGGAGSAFLSGVPSRVEVTVVDPGKFADNYPAPFKVENIELKPDLFDNSYVVRAKVTTGADEIRSADIGANVVLRNSNGAIVGGTFWQAEGLPEVMPPNTAFTAEASFIQVTEKPASAEVFAQVEPKPLP